MHEAFHRQVLPSKGVDNIQCHHNSHQRVRGFLHNNIRLLNMDFARMIPKLQQWLQIDFSSLREPRLNYESQMQIDPH
jgi:hypothetical protein